MFPRVEAMMELVSSASSRRSFPCWWLPFVILIATSSLLSAPSPLLAGDVPASARSLSLGIEPEFLEDIGLIFAYPQRAASAPAQLFALGTSRGPSGAGGMARIGRGQAFLLSQTILLGAGRAGSANTAAARLGWAGRQGAWQAGLSAGGHLKRSTGGMETESWYGGSHHDYDLRLYNRNNRTAEATAGVGLVGGRGSLDAAWSMTWEDWEDGNARYERESGSGESHSAAIFTGDRRPLHAVRLRGRWTTNHGAEFVGFGGWRGRSEGADVRLRGELLGVAIDSAGSVHDYRDDWRVGLGFGRPTGSVDHLMLSVAYGSSRGPVYVSYSAGNAYRETTVRRTGLLSISAREFLPRRFVAHVGLRRGYAWAESSRLELSMPSRYALDREQSESTTTDFNWGLGWSWRNIELTGALSTSLDFHYLFSTLDLRLTL